MAALRGQPPGGYPYPLETERGPVRTAYRSFLRAPAVLALLGPAEAPDRTPPDRDVPDRSVTLRVPSPLKTDGPGQGPGPSEIPDFDWC